MQMARRALLGAGTSAMGRMSTRNEQLINKQRMEQTKQSAYAKKWVVKKTERLVTSSKQFKLTIKNISHIQKYF